MNANLKFNKLLLLLFLFGLAAACDTQPAQLPQENTDSLSISNISMNEEGKLSAQGHAFTRAFEETKSYSVTLPGRVVPDPGKVHRISLLFGGRIAAVNVHRELEKVSKGQLLLEVYSPEILTVQREYLSLLDQPGNARELTRKKLILLGLSDALIRKLETTGLAMEQIPVYSPVNGYIKWSSSIQAGSSAETPGSSTPASQGGMNGMNNTAGETPPSQAQSNNARPEGLVPGQSVSKGMVLLEIIELGSPWISIDFQEGMTLQKGNRLLLEDGTGLEIRSISAQAGAFSSAFAILPADKNYFIGELLKVTIPVSASGWWVSRKAVLSTGTEKLVFLKTGDKLAPFRVNTGLQTDSFIQLLAPFPPGEVAANAWFLLEEDQNIKP